jgi:hypothetical protein
MAGDFRDFIDPIGRREAIDRLEGHGGPQLPPQRMAQSIAGRIVAIHRGQRQAPGGHRIDFSVGGDEFTEIVVRVPRGAYGNLEGKRAVLYVDE